MVAVFAAGSLAGCSASVGAGLDKGGPVAYVEDVSGSGMDALLDGTLEVRDTCIVVLREGHSTLPVFEKPRTAWDGTTLSYEGRSFVDGAPIRLGGGEVDPSVADYLPAECDYEAVFLVASTVRDSD